MSTATRTLATNAVRLSRREFLAKTSAGSAALVIGFYLPWDAEAQEPQPTRQTPNPFNAWVRIDKDNKVTLLLAKSEMGQSVYTTLPIILAEELDVDWAQVSIQQAPTDPRIYNHGTGGSSSVRTTWTPLRQAGATAREMLVAATATRWNVNPDSCRTAKGVVYTGPRDKHVTYGELVEDAAKLPLPDFNKVTLKNPNDFQMIGRSIPRADIPGKVDGSAKFGLDVRVPGMLYAVVARCPTFGGKVAKFEATKAKAVPGVRHVFEIPAVDAGAHTAGGIAVVAESTWAAMKGREALEIEWDHGPNSNESNAWLRKQFEEISKQPGKSIRNEGDADAALGAAATKIEAVYELPFQAHACMEPMNCTVHIRPDGADCWAPTQGPQWGLDLISKVSGLTPDKIKVHTTLMGGGFGRRYQGDFFMEAAQIAKEAKAPVQLVWTREDDMQHDFYRPAAYHKFAAALDAQGAPVAWHDRMTSTSITSFWEPESKKPEDSEIEGASNLPYAIPNIRVEYTPAKMRTPVSWWRSVEHSINGFAVESFLDELAAVAKVDPLAFRQKLLAEPRRIKTEEKDRAPLNTQRLKAVLELAARQAGWGTPLAPKRGMRRGRGLACHYSFQTYVGQVAEVSVAKDGAVKVDRIVAAVDCGRVIQPDGLKAQVESSVVYALSAALKGAITVAEGRVQQSNFHDFPVLRINEVPVVEVHIIPSTENPTGIGEPGLPPVASAVCNAIFAATGKRIRRLPIRPQDLA